MKKERFVRAWKDPEYRASLSPEERAELPECPSGQPELEETELEATVGGAPPRTLPLRSCMYVCVSTDICNA
jgi:mersacidin/lichenicidin family type 2 lantibiotic